MFSVPILKDKKEVSFYPYNLLLLICMAYTNFYNLKDSENQELGI